MVSSIKKLRISPKLFIFGKTIDLPVGRQPSLPPFIAEDVVQNLHIQDDYEKLLIKHHGDLERRQKAMSVELIIIAKEKESIQVCREVLRQKKVGASSTRNPAT